jgi:hypothetical protein
LNNISSLFAPPFDLHNNHSGHPNIQGSIFHNGRIYCQNRDQIQYAILTILSLQPLINPMQYMFQQGLLPLIKLDSNHDDDDFEDYDVNDDGNEQGANNDRLGTEAESNT